MKETFKLSGNILFKIVVVTLMAAFVCLSANIICMAAFKGDEIGYTAIVYDADNNAVKSYNHYFENGDDLIKVNYEDNVKNDGYTIKTEPLFGITKTGRVIYAVVTQLIICVLLVAFVYAKLWKQGLNDENLANFGHIAEDKLRGLKIGLIVSAPYFAIYFWLLISYVTDKSLGLASSVYAICNYHFSPIIDVIWRYESMPSGAMQFVYMFLLLLFVPIVSCVAYLLGYKGISLSEKLTYKKNKED